VALIHDPCLSPEQHELRDLISDVTEIAHYAGWLPDTEFEVWRLAIEGGSWGHCRSASEAQPTLGNALALARKLGVWIVWDETGLDCENRAVSLDDWQTRFDAWRGTHHP
jgi:hypothetical protein